MYLKFSLQSKYPLYLRNIRCVHHSPYPFTAVRRQIPEKVLPSSDLDRLPPELLPLIDQHIHDFHHLADRRPVRLTERFLLVFGQQSRLYSAIYLSEMIRLL